MCVCVCVLFNRSWSASAEVTVKLINQNIDGKSLIKSTLVSHFLAMNGKLQGLYKFFI